jgi:hypothetical protein
MVIEQSRFALGRSDRRQGTSQPMTDKLPGQGCDARGSYWPKADIAVAPSRVRYWV